MRTTHLSFHPIAWFKVKQKKQGPPNGDVPACGAITTKSTGATVLQPSLQLVPSLFLPTVNVQRTQEQQSGQTRVLLRGNKPISHRSHSKVLPGAWSVAREFITRALGKHPHKLSLHICSPLDTYHCSPQRYDTLDNCPAGHRPSRRYKKPQSRTE